MTSFVAIRKTHADELERLRSIELAAGVLFREIGMADIAEHPPPSLAAFERYQQAGLAWTAAVEDLAVGFVVVNLVDGCAHIEQVSVHPEHARRGIGRALIDGVGRWAAGQGLPALTLSTFRAVAWNAPYYARLGFRELSAAEVTPGLTAIRQEEAALGLNPADRLLMRREPPAPPAGIETAGVSK